VEGGRGPQEIVQSREGRVVSGIEDLLKHVDRQIKRQSLSCPHCDHVENEWYECLSTPTYLNDEFTDWQEVDCSKCERKYKARVRQLLDFEVEK